MDDPRRNLFVHADMCKNQASKVYTWKWFRFQPDSKISNLYHEVSTYEYEASPLCSSCGPEIRRRNIIVPGTEKEGRKILEEARKDSSKYNKLNKRQR